jgi:inner membrane protein
LDNLTHSLAGAHLARLPPLDRAGPGISLATALVASNLPDADVLLLLGGQATYVFGHRTATHSLLGIAVMAPLVALAASLAARRPLREVFAPLLLLSLAGLAGHLLLDVPTSWGTALFWPFSPERVALPWMFIIDVFVIALLGLPLLRDWARRRAGRTVTPGRTAALALVSVALYAAICGNLQARARTIAVESVVANAPPAPGETAEAHAWPVPFGPLLWTTVVSTDPDVWHRAFVSALTGGVTPAGDFPTGRADPRVQVALETPVGRRWAAFAEAPYVAAASPLADDGSFQVAVGDLRFTGPFAEAAPFELWLKVGPAFQVVASELRTGRVPPEPNTVAARTP